MVLINILPLNRFIGKISSQNCISIFTVLYETKIVTEKFSHSDVIILWLFIVIRGGADGSNLI